MAIIAGGKNMAKIGFIGMGNMGSAILNGLLRVYKPEDLLFTAAHKEKMEAVTAKTGVPHAAVSYTHLNWKRRRGNFMGGRSIIDIVCALEILGVVLFLTAPQFVMNYLILNPAAILHGQIWRIVTFLVYPPAITGSDAIMFVLMNALGIYCISAFGMIVAQVWGKFRFNCYIIGGVLLHSAAAVSYTHLDVYKRQGYLPRQSLIQYRSFLT